MGEVWLAEHQYLANRVAIKVLAPYLRDRPDFSERFLNEARSQARLSHPHIVAVKDFFIEQGQYYMVTEYCPGLNLHELIVTRGELPVAMALEILKPVLAALNHAHSRGVIHRDIKPANLMVSDISQAKVMDFGLAAVAGVRRQNSDHQVIGSPHYMSPEQIRDPNCSDHSIDTYAMGIVLYEMLTARVPFDGQTSAEIWEQHLNETPISPRTHSPAINQTLNQIILKAIEKDPEQRFAGCGEFLEFIAYWEQEEMNSAGTQVRSQIAGKRQVREAARTPPGRPLQKQTQVQPAHEPPPHPLSTSRKVVPASKPSPAKIASGPQAVQAAPTAGFVPPRREPASESEPILFARNAEPHFFGLFFCVLAYSIPELLSLVTPPDTLGLPIFFEAVSRVYMGGVTSPVGLTTSLILFSFTYSCFWLWRAVAQHGHHHEPLLRAFGLALLLALFNGLILFHWVLPAILYLMLKIQVLTVNLDSQGKIVATEVSQWICYLLWLAMVALMALLARTVSTFYEGDQ